MSEFSVVVVESQPSPRKRKRIPFTHHHHAIPHIILCLTVLFSFFLVVVAFLPRAGSSSTTGDYICDPGETRDSNATDCCPSVKNYICEDFTACGDVDPDCIDTGECLGSSSEYAPDDTINGYPNSKKFCYPGYCSGGLCITTCSADSNCTSGLCTAGDCTYTKTAPNNTPALSLTSPGVAIFEGDDLQIPYTIIYKGNTSSITIDSFEFEGVFGRVFKPETNSITVVNNTRETVMVNVDSFELSKMFIGYLEPGRYQLNATIRAQGTMATDVLDLIVLPTFVLQNTKNLPSQRTIGHMVRQVVVNDSDHGKFFPAEVEVWVW